jgi:hypothetical protein
MRRFAWLSKPAALIQVKPPGLLKNGINKATARQPHGNATALHLIVDNPVRLCATLQGNRLALTLSIAPPATDAPKT